MKMKDKYKDKAKMVTMENETLSDIELYKQQI